MESATAALRPVWIVTGLSGAGKATALAALERAGFDCIDNLPVTAVGSLAALGQRSSGIAVVVDARQGVSLGALVVGAADGILFLDARDEVLLRRLSESTRPHPCASAGAGSVMVRAERELLEPLRAAADAVVDTSELSAPELAERVVELVGGHGDHTSMLCTVSSFGFKYGPQLDADWVVDVRFLRNPFWNPELRPLTGLDPRVVSYIWSDATAREARTRLIHLLGWVVPQAHRHGRSRLHVAFGCTGGRHRSVVVAMAVATALRTSDLDVVVRHRDIERPDPR